MLNLAATETENIWYIYSYNTGLWNLFSRFMATFYSELSPYKHPIAGFDPPPADDTYYEADALVPISLRLFKPNTVGARIPNKFGIWMVHCCSIKSQPFEIRTFKMAPLA